MNIQNIPLTKLVPSAANVRKTGANVGIEELAASIAAHGLLQNLQVRLSAKGKYEVVAGGRRLAALKLLAKQKSLGKDSEIPCHVLDAEDAGEISLAENTVRLSMHPADQFAAFQALTLSGKGPEEIAARFGVSVAVVRQRLKLATVSPSLIEIYRDDEMTLDQLMAFTVSDDCDAQEAAWFGQPEWLREPDKIRSNLTAAHVESDDKRVRLIGLDAYIAAGGGIFRDLFQPDHEGYLTEPSLLDRLVSERLEAEAATVRAEGWKWVEIMPDLDFSSLSRFARAEPHRLPLPAARQEELDRLSQEYESLIEKHGEDPEQEISDRLDTLSQQIDDLSEGEEVWQPEDIALAGALIGIRHDGSVEIKRGLVRPEDKKTRLAVLEGGKGDEGKPADAASPLSASLIEDLTAERTAALRAMVVENQAIALASVAHALALPLFYPHAFKAESCLALRLVSRDLRKSAEQSDDSSAAVLLRNRQGAWEKRLPEDAARLFGWLLSQESLTITGLITFCAAMSVDAVRGKQDRSDCPRLAHGDELAASLGLDMSLWWKPTKDSYLGRVSKALILDAVSEGVSKKAAENLENLKKDVLVVRAEERLAGRSWVPSVLRMPQRAASEPEWEALAAE